MATHMGRVLVFRGQSHPTKEGGPAESQCLPIWGFLSIYAYTLCCRTTKFEVVAHVVEEEHVSWVGMHR